MIRLSGNRAIYKDREYEFSPKYDGLCTIYSDDLRDEANGFTRIDMRGSAFWETDKLFLIVPLEELSFVFKRKTTVIYKGDEFRCNVINGNQIMLLTADPVLHEKHNMIEREKNEYRLYVDVRDVDEIIQKWFPLPQYIKD